MKKSILLLLFLPLFAAAQTEKTVKTSVQKATVFLQGAELFSAETLTLGAGTTHVVFENVSPSVLPESVQASAVGDAVIMDVRYNLKYRESVPKTTDPARKKTERDLRIVLDSITEIDFVAKGVQNQLNNLRTERQVLLQNRLMRGEQQRDSLATFTQSIDFLRLRLNDIDTRSLALEREAHGLSGIRTQLQTRQQTLQTLLSGNYDPAEPSPQPVPQVIVTVMAPQALTTKVSIRYFVAQAGWTASYDLRAAQAATEIELNHKAAVYQNTGVDWSNVQLTLSTGNPNLSNEKPVLSPFYLNFYRPGYARDDLARQQRAFPTGAAKPATEDAFAAPAEVAAEEKDHVGDYVTVSENLLRVEYEIGLKYDVRSDGQPHNVVIQSRKVPATYQYSVVPKLDPDAFLVARITDWEDLKLVPGPARIFFDGSYVGQTHLNPNGLGDTLQVNLGRDKSIVIKREKVKDKSKDRILSENRVVSVAYQISVRNTKNIAIRIVVEDQMPVSQDGAIKIEYLEDSKANFNPDTGKLVWDLRIDPKENRKLSFGYEVRFPKERTLSVL